MKVIRITLVVLFILSFAAACDKAPELTILPGVRLQAWIDAPLDGMQLQLAPYQVVFHITDIDPVSSGELSINDSVVALLPNPEPGTNFAALGFDWTPPGYGVYTIRARAQGQDGSWGNYAQVVVEVVEPTPTATPTDIATPTPTATPTVTPTPTATPTPTLTPTRTPLPGPAPITFDNVRVNTTQIYAGLDGCGRKEVDVYVTFDAASKVQNVTLTYRVVDRNFGEVSSWVTEPMSLTEPGGTQWIITVKPETDIPGGFVYAAATFEYYFTATNSAGTVKSNTFANVKVDYCRTR